ncbi:hypothetical protein ABXW34_20880, partial [Streptococcus suis]
MTQKQELVAEIEELTTKRNRLLAQIKEAEQWESVAWDSFHALADHVNAMEKKRKIAQNYWDSSQSEITHQF